MSMFLTRYSAIAEAERKEREGKKVAEVKAEKPETSAPQAEKKQAKRSAKK